MNPKDWIGQTVPVRVDRPLGSCHPIWGYRYPVNYGFIPSTRAGDSEEIDVYIIDATTSIIGEIWVTVIGGVLREDDDEDKLIAVVDSTKKMVAPPGSSRHRVSGTVLYNQPFSW